MQLRQSIPESEFEEVIQDLDIQDPRLRRQQQKLHRQVFGVVGQMKIHQVVLELQIEVNRLQKEDNSIIEEASTLFQGLYVEIADLSKKHMANSLELLNIQNTFRKLKDKFKAWKNTEQSLQNMQ